MDKREITALPGVWTPGAIVCPNCLSDRSIWVIYYDQLGKMGLINHAK